MAGDPTPEQRADFLVRKLEQLIRDGRSYTAGKGGMSFSTWQAMARVEIANAFADQEKRAAKARSDRFARRLLITTASCLTTIGFWGAVVAIDKNFGQLAALALFVSGLLLLAVASEWGIRKAASHWVDKERLRRFERVEDIDKRIKQLERDMQKKHDRLKEKAENSGLGF